MPEYVPSVGMEVHAELATRSKMFCRCAVAFGGEPNTRTCPVCLALPGTLPVPNKAAVEMVVRTALALNCKINYKSGFQRKNYFYPDIPKGYQISQYQHPLGYDGYLDLPSGKRIQIRRVHLEEDTGKLMHLPQGGSGVDYNRAGVPLMEVVTEFPPDITNAEDAKEYLVQLRQILLYLGVCDGKMEEGSLRCEPNISVRPVGSDVYGTKTELKNLNSFRSVQLGVGFEVRRQVAVLEHGDRVIQETRGWNEQREASFSMRVKESENDYRYFSDPDLLPMVLGEGYIEELRKTLPELPLAKTRRYEETLGLSAYDAGVLSDDMEWAGYFDEAVQAGGDPKTICNLLTQDFASLLKEDGITPRQSNISPPNLVELSQLIAKGAISSKMGKGVLKEMFRTGKSAQSVVQEQGLSQITDSSEIEAVVAKVLEQHAEVVAKYRSGQTNVKGFLVGQAMRASAGRANPGMVQEIVTKQLENG